MDISTSKALEETAVIVDESGRPTEIAAATADSVWLLHKTHLELRKNKSLESKPSSSICLPKPLKDSDWKIRMKLEIPIWGLYTNEILFINGTERSRIQFVEDFKSQGGWMQVSGKLFGKGPRYSKIDHQNNRIELGVPFDVTIAREGNVTSIAIDGEPILKHKTSDSSDPGIVLLKGAGNNPLYVYAFSITGEFGVLQPEYRKAHTLTRESQLLSDYPARLSQDPLKFEDEFVEVTMEGSLRRRYYAWGDWREELAKRVDVAKKRMESLGRKPKKFVTVAVFLEEAEISWPNVKDSDGNPVRGHFSTRNADKLALSRTVAKEWSDFIYAASGGERENEWKFVTLKGLKWVNKTKKNTLVCQPKLIEDQLLDQLHAFSNGEVDQWLFFAGPATIENPPSDEWKTSNFRYGGVAYTKWPLLGAYTSTLTSASLGIIAHEVSHQIFDGNLSRTEGLKLTKFHKLGWVGGYTGSDCGFPSLYCNYLNVYTHVYRPEMWRRLKWEGTHGLAPLPFLGKGFSWDEVKDDCWMKLPCLTDKNIEQLLGIPGIKYVDSDKEPKSHILIPQEKQARIKSPVCTPSVSPTVAVDNFIDFDTETAAVVKSDTGHWIFAQIDMVDLYVDIPRIQGLKTPKLPVYGYISREGSGRPLVLIKAPSVLDVPEREIGYFRPD